MFQSVGMPSRAGTPTIVRMLETLETKVAGSGSTGEVRDFSFIRSSWDVNSSKNNNSEGTPATAETITTAGTQGKPTVEITLATAVSIATAEAA
jgi:hypothetical protein